MNIFTEFKSYPENSKVELFIIEGFFHKSMYYVFFLVLKSLRNKVKKLIVMFSVAMYPTMYPIINILHRLYDDHDWNNYMLDIFVLKFSGENGII